MLEQESALDAVTVSALRAAHAEVLVALDEAGPEGRSGLPGQIVLHGDAHDGNLLSDAERGWVWADLEETCRGPAAWDLATVVSRYDATASQIALRAYASEAKTAVPDVAELAHFSHARKLEGAVWSLCMAQLYPARYAAVADCLLSEVLAR